LNRFSSLDQMEVCIDCNRYSFVIVISFWYPDNASHFIHAHSLERVSGVVPETNLEALMILLLRPHFFSRVTYILPSSCKKNEHLLFSLISCLSSYFIHSELMVVTNNRIEEKITSNVVIEFNFNLTLILVTQHFENDLCLRVV